jgi:HD-like signal output (HDOD) protein
MNLTDWMQRRTGEQPRQGLDALKANVGALGRLPTLPEAATRAMAVAKDPNSSLKKLSAVIERDPALAAGLLKLANSPLYRTRFAVESVHHAVVKLGTRECQNLILAVGMRSLFRNVPRARQLRYEGLWKHSFLTGCVCRHLGRALNLGYDGEEFAAGLSHDIGRVLLGLAAPDLSEQADPMDFVEGPDLLEREAAVLGTDHCYFGAWFANLNNLPASLVNAVQFHHTPEAAGEHQRLVALVAAADHMANHYQRDHDVEHYDGATNPAWPLLESFVGGEQPFPEIAAAVLADAVKEAAEVVGVAA